MKEERRRQKQLEANFEEEYFEDHGGEESDTATSYSNKRLLFQYMLIVHLRSLCLFIFASSTSSTCEDVICVCHTGHWCCLKAMLV